MTSLPTLDKAGVNPYGLCTWADESVCAGCDIKGRLVCRHSWADLAAFGALFMPFFVASVAGMVRAGFGWWIVGWVAYMALFFNVWETYVLCRHCPYYARSGSTLVCLANQGCLKIWDFEPGPATRGEQAQFLIGAGLLVLFPFPFMLLGAQWLLAGIAAVCAVSFFYNLRVKTCRECVNFSCALNNTPREVRDAYLRRNPVMRDAWVASGYKLDGD